MNPLILKDLFRFILFLFLVAGLSYGIHYFVVSSYFPNEIFELVNFAYKFNVGITLLFTSSIILASGQLKEQLGFIFLISGMVKLGIFYFLIKTSGFVLDKSVFLHFFVPYALSVVVEIIYISKILNRTNFSKDR
ncbi:hypothetical protein JRG66_07080 [Salinimicrobium tongyeongense]|uniref:Uncharacterized protein n=1 Tax=Salinimicrobium tongyeongense TaxID=2809707 RepID=A0ABY6NVV1_9FLAO|nr:hypothetical protein [Salinimicrobium tongyeongense]UZH56608.1 hypothetical protein JRG66_07080 [Salinimicrobium tongyeongense]